VVQAAEAMRAMDIGDVIVTRDNMLAGIVTDRDIVVRAIAMGLDPRQSILAEVVTARAAFVSPEQPIQDAARLMREHALRRLPVCDSANHVVGVVSLGDLAAERDLSSVLSDISAAPPNN
jgi:CBS domain-containing protein